MDSKVSFFRGEIDKYTWVGLGSSFLPSEISSAFFMQQGMHVNILPASA